jgi:putative ABC transport system ATP-binding protein
MTPLALKLRDVDKIYRTEELETHALSKVHLDVAAGEFVAISGPSGCGKSTLLAVLGLLDAPSAGRIELNGEAVATLDPAARAARRNREIGFIFQSYQLLGELSVLDNVALPLEYRPGVSRSAARERARAALERVGMVHRLAHRPAQLSGGQQQRVAVARALVGEPKLLLADEPTGNLDSVNGDQVMALISALNTSGTTLVMVTHDPRHAARAPRELKMFDGRIVDEVTR